MQFDVIIGNPPYHMSDGEGLNGATPIYHKFVLQAMNLKPRYLIMIIPSRWFTGGRGLDNFREIMLKDKRIQQIHDFSDASTLFPGVEIKGGINFFLWDSSYEGEATIYTYEDGFCISKMKRPLKENGSDVFIRMNESISIFRKIREFKERSLSEIVSSAKPFGFRTFFRGVATPFKDSVKIYVNRGIGYVDVNDIKKNKEWVSQHKVIAPYAVGSGDSKTDWVKPIYCEPNSCCSETYIVFGPLGSESKCKNLMTYMNTRFFHFFLTLKKNTQHTTREVYKFVPQQNFDETWSDEKLYKKYGLSQNEIAYIESMVRPMD